MDELLIREIRALDAALPASLDRQALARTAGLTAPLHEVVAAHCNDDTLLRLWRAIMQLSGDPTLPFDVGTKIPFGTYEVIDYLAGACATVGEGLEKLSRYFDIITPTLQWACDGLAEPPHVLLRSELSGPEEHVVFMQYALGVTFQRFCSLAEGGVEFVAVELAIAEPPSKVIHERFFSCPIRYGAKHSRCVLSRASWNAPLSRREPGLVRVLEQHAKDLLSRCEAADDRLAPVRMAVHKLLPDGPPKLESVAKTLAMSSRTLQRRLRETGTTFQEIVEEERQSAARAYLGDAQLAVAEIAYLLGYSEASAFVRAFKRWTGTTPGQFRSRAA